MTEAGREVIWGHLETISGPVWEVENGVDSEVILRSF